MSPQNTLGLHGTLTPGHAVTAFSTSTIQDGGAAPASQTPWTSDIDGNGHSLFNALNVSGTGQITGGFILSTSDSDATGNMTAQTDQGYDVAIGQDIIGGDNGLVSVPRGLLYAGFFGCHNSEGDDVFEFASQGGCSGPLIADPYLSGGVRLGDIYTDTDFSNLSISPQNRGLYNDLGLAFTWDGAGLFSSQGATFGSVTSSGALSSGTTLGVGTSFSVGTTLTSYNGQTTAGVGQAFVVAHDSKTNLSGASGAIPTTTIYAVPSGKGGLYRVTAYANVVSGAGGSSSLGGLSSNLLKITYTDATTSNGLTVGPVANVSGANLAANTTAAIYVGSAVVNAKSSTNLQYSFDYSTAGGSPMVYNFKIVVEKLD